MSQFYIDPARETDKWSLPDGEAFYADAGEWAYDANGERCDTHADDEEQEVNGAGWYWWVCLPGCMPDSDPHGPFETEEAAIADAREFYGE